MQFTDSFTETEIPPVPVRRFSVDEYHRLAEAGVLGEDDRVELLEGWIVEKMNQRPIHGFVVGLLTELIASALPAGWIVRCQLPITTERSEPEPDLAIVSGSHLDYRNRHPVGKECRLVIEVADTSVQRDRAKTLIYSRAGVHEYWIINLAEKRLERFSRPTEGQYSTEDQLAQCDAIELSIDNTPLRIELGPLFEE